MIRDLIFDVGANNGDDTGYYLQRGYRVVAVEAIPEFASAIADRFRDAVHANRLTVLAVAIGEWDATMEFFVSEGNRAVWSSLDPASAGREGLSTRKIIVPTIPIGSLFEKFGVPFYLKVDIEGLDHLCVWGINPSDPPQYLSFEASPGRLIDLYKAFEKGYRKFKLIDQGAGFRMVNPPPLHSMPMARHILANAAKRRLKALPGLHSGIGGLRRLLSKQSRPSSQSSPTASFPMSSSGPMGEETDGTWESVDAVAYAWLYALDAPRLSHWYDVHATF